MVKGSYPIGTYCKNIYIIFLNIFHFLPGMILNNNFICKARSTDIINPVDQGVDNIQLSSGFIILLGGDPHDQVIPQRFCSLQQIIMSFMKQIERSVCYYFPHLRHSSLYRSLEISILNLLFPAIRILLYILLIILIYRELKSKD